jgi:serine/threonine protein kinase/CRP-like cAMP-binding protein
VLREGVETHALYQILKGSLRVELQLQGQATAVVVGHRGAGEMFGETSLLKASPATASIAVDSEEAILVCVEGSYLEKLFSSHETLPGRFFAFLATYQAERLRRLTDTFTPGKRRSIAVQGANRQVPVDAVFSNPAYEGIFRQFLEHTRRNCADDERAGYEASGHALEFVHEVRDAFRGEPNVEAMQATARRLSETYVREGGAKSLGCLDGAARKALGDKAEAVAAAKPAKLKLKDARALYDEAVKLAIDAIARHCFSEFLASDHFPYILELKAKEGIVPNVPDFRPLRVLGEGGFGQVLEVVKRDCGKHYAMKVMHKNLMRQCFGGAWREKILLEKDLMASLHHPFLVNLLYAFQNIEFLVLVMDLVPAGDLSDFVLTEARLTQDQIRVVMMEVVCVLGYCHSQGVLYRDLKPENLLIDEQGHVRLIDMGLAARITKQTPKRMSRVGTECYMAPEVRWAEKRRTPYGVSADWYTVGVLLYEFSAGDLPYEDPDQDKPVYSPFTFPDKETADLVSRLLEQDHSKRLGSGKNGLADIQAHAYWKGVEWDLLPLKKFESPCKGIKPPDKEKARKKKEKEAVKIASEMAAQDGKEDGSAPVHDWDFVSPNAIVEEYMENMYRLVSSI